jgi:hypothetical protein
VTATITPLGDERYRVHTAHGVSTFRTLDEAWAWAEAEAERLASRQAELSGAGEIAVESERVATTARADDGTEVFFEGVVTATARGPARND